MAHKRLAEACAIFVIAVPVIILAGARASADWICPGGVAVATERSPYNSYIRIHHLVYDNMWTGIEVRTTGQGVKPNIAIYNNTVQGNGYHPWKWPCGVCRLDGGGSRTGWGRPQPAAGAKTQHFLA